MPNARLPGQHYNFIHGGEGQASRQPLDFLNQELARSQGHSSAANRAEYDLKSLLDGNYITDL